MNVTVASHERTIAVWLPLDLGGSIQYPFPTNLCILKELIDSSHVHALSSPLNKLAPHDGALAMHPLVLLAYGVQPHHPVALRHDNLENLHKENGVGLRWHTETFIFFSDIKYDLSAGAYKKE